MQIIPLASLPSSTWSGGTTTELFLSPATASYAARDFDVRISSATVDVDSSEFTPLPGFERYLAVLTEPLTLTVNGTTKTLNPGEVLRFSGDDVVTSQGRTTDFNVMVRRGTPASVTYVDGTVVGSALAFDVDSRSLIQLDAGESHPVRGYLVSVAPYQGTLATPQRAHPLAEDVTFGITTGTALALAQTHDPVLLIAALCTLAVAATAYTRHVYGQYKHPVQRRIGMAGVAGLVALSTVAATLFWRTPLTDPLTVALMAGCFSLVMFGTVRVISALFTAPTKAQPA